MAVKRASCLLLALLLATVVNPFVLPSQSKDAGSGQAPLPAQRFSITPADKVWGSPFIFSPDGKLLITPLKRSIKVYDAVTGNLIRELAPDDNWQSDKLGTINISSNSQFLAIDAIQNRVRVWDVKSFERKLVVTDVDKHDFSGLDLNLIATIGKEKNVINMWDVRTGRLVSVLTLPREEYPWAVQFSPDGEALLISSFSGIYVYEPLTWKLVKEMKKQSANASPVLGFSFSPDSRLVAMVGLSAIVAVQDMKTYERKFWLQGHKKQVYRADFSPDGSWLATTSDDKTAKLWDMSTGQVAQTLTEKSGAVRFVYFSPNGRLLATSGTKREYVELLSLPDCKVKATIPSDREAHAAFHPDGRSIAVSNKDGSITVWDISTIK